MDVDTAWEHFEKSNKTSVDDKLDVILAQQQEIINDTSRTADLVPLVTGDKAEEDALEETGDVEGTPEQDESETLQDESEGMSEDMGEDNPFSFLDEGPVSEDDGIEETDDEEGDIVADENDYEATDEESDIDTQFQSEDVPETDEESEDEGTLGEEESTEESYDEEDTDGESEDYSEEDTEEESDEEGSDDESEEESEDDESKEESEDKKDEEEYISFDELDEDDKKASKSVTKTIKSFSARTPMVLVRPVSRPEPNLSYGRSSGADTIAEMLSKSFKTDDNFDIGFGVDPHKVVEKDWAEYRMMQRLNTF